MIDPKEETMVDYGLKNKVAIITGANNPWGIGATTALAFAREGAKVVLVYKKIPRDFDKNKTDQNGADRYFEANLHTLCPLRRTRSQRNESFYYQFYYQLVCWSMS